MFYKFALISFAQVVGQLSLTLPIGCLVEDSGSIATPSKETAATKPTTAPVEGAEDADRSANKSPFAALIETPRKECFALTLQLPNSFFAQQWFKIITQRLGLTVSQSTIPSALPGTAGDVAPAKPATVQANSSSVPFVCDKTTTADMMAPAECSDDLIGAYSFAHSSAVLLRLEAEWVLQSSASSSADVVADRSALTAAASVSAWSKGGATTAPIVDADAVLPVSGLLLFKVLLVQEIPSSDADVDMDVKTLRTLADSNSSQMKGWMSCWVRIDCHLKTVTFYDQGPGSAPSLSISCVHAALHVPDLTDPALGCELNLYNCSVRNTPNGASMSIAVKLPSALELFRWVMTLSPMVDTVTYCSGGVVHSATQTIDYLQTAAEQAQQRVPVAIGSQTDFSSTTPNMMEICLAAIEALAERKMCSSYIRHVQLNGSQIKSARFLQMNQRIVLLMKGNCSSLTEGSVLLSVNGLSTVSTAASTILKFIADFPRQMIGELTLWKFPRMEFQVDIVRLAEPIAEVHSSAAEKAIKETEEMLASFDSITASSNKPLDPKSMISKVMIQKRNSILKFNSGIDVSSDGGSLPTIISNLQKEIYALEGNTVKTDSQASTGGSVNVEASVAATAAAMNNKTLPEFLRTPPAEVHWLHCRVMIASGNVSMLTTGEDGRDVPLCRLQLSSCEIKLVYPSLATGISNLCIDMKDSKSHIVIKCPTLSVFIDLSECLLITMNMLGSCTVDLAHLYDQSVTWKNIQERSVRGSNDIYDSSFKPQSLFMQSVVASARTNKSQRSIKIEPDSSILQAAEALESTLTRLQLPLNFPTHTVIEKELVELFKLNNANHRLLAEFLTLQFEVMNPIEHFTPPAVARRHRLASSSQTDNSGVMVTTSTPFSIDSSSTADLEQSADGDELKQHGESSTSVRDKLMSAFGMGEDDVSNGSKEGGEEDSNKGSSNTNSTTKAPKTTVVTETSPPSSATARRASVQMRSGSVMMGGSSAPVASVTGMSTANRRATFRKSAITHSQEQAAVLLMSHLEKQVQLQVKL